MKTGTVTLNLRTQEAAQEAKDAIFEAVQEVFELDIKARAVEGSPVKTGTNRRSIDTEITQEADGPHATIFSQSGYGGYLEVGTRKMSAQPYLNPAVEEGLPKIPLAVKEKLATGD